MIAAVALLGLGAAACSSSSQGAPGASTGGGPSTPAASPAVLEIAPANGVRAVKPGQPITVSVQDGKLLHVKLQGPSGGPVPGRLSHHKTMWHSTAVLHTSTRYTVHATAVNADGKASQVTSQFQTLKPKAVVRATIFEAHNGTYGVGMPIILNFDHPVTHKRAVEKALSVTSSRPVVGALNPGYQSAA